MDKIIVDITYSNYLNVNLDNKIEKFLGKTYKKCGFDNGKRHLRFEYGSAIACKNAKKLIKKFPEAEIEVRIK